MKKLSILLLSALSFTVFGQEYKLGKYELKTIDNVNTSFSDFGVSYLGTKQVVFSSPKKKKLFTRKWKDNDQPYLELYKGKLTDSGTIVEVQKFSEEINSKYHEAQVAFTRDRKMVYFTSNNYLDKKYIKSDSGVNNLQLYRANVDEKGKWSNIQLLPFNDKNYSCGHPALANKDRDLYFVSDMPGGLGGTDIYKVQIIKKNKFTKPKNLGAEINTKGKEMFPFVKSDTLLYYSSDGKTGGKGGLDIYVNRKLGSDFDRTLHMPEPLNSKADDFAFVLAKNGKGFISSNRAGGKGDDDIYAFKEIEPLHIEMPCFQYMKGVVVDKINGTRVKKARVFLYDVDRNLIEKVKTDSLGNFVIKKQLECDTPLFVYAKKKRHLPDSLNVASKVEYNFNHEVKLELTPQFIKINPIYFDYNKAFIREDAAKELDKVVKVMKDYPTMTVEGGSHTDSRGRDSYNERLSARRAKSTVDYIISKGISADRITSKGYGETQLVNHCSNGVECSKEEHQLNRRTEFKILKY